MDFNGFFVLFCSLQNQHSSAVGAGAYTMDTTMSQIPNNTTVMDSGSLSVLSSNTETPPPGYMSEDGDPMDQNDNLSESKLLVDLVNSGFYSKF